MLKATSKARKQDLGLTVVRATREARKYVDKLMPGVNATVDSRTGYDLATDTPVIITTVTFPENHHNRMGLKLATESLLDARSELFAARLVITRKR